MKATVDFPATRALIVHAFKVFSEGFEKRKLEADRLRQEWVEEQIIRNSKSWLVKKHPREYWEAYSRGEKGDSFDRYEMGYQFTMRVENYIWFEARLKDATQLLQKFDCAVDDCEASTVYLSDDDLTLLSVSLQSAEMV